MPPTHPDVEIRRSARRRRTVSARREGTKTIVFLPAGLSPGQERDWVERMLTSLGRQEARRRQRTSREADPASAASELSRRAARLSRDILDGRP